MNISEAKFKEFEQQAEKVKVMGHALRLAILGLLIKKHKLSVTEIFQEIGIEQAVASHHLRLLKSAGIVSLTKSGKHSYYYIANDSIRIVYEQLINL